MNTINPVKIASDTHNQPNIEPMNFILFTLY